jgi:hypothetical protein
MTFGLYSQKQTHPRPPQMDAADNPIIIIIKFYSILYYLCAESTAKRPITDTAQSNAGIYTIEKKIPSTQLKIVHWVKK